MSSRVVTVGQHGLQPIGDRSTNDAGEPVQRFRARVLRPGRFIHPKAGWTLDVDDARLGELRDTAEAMLDADGTIPLVSAHFATDARDTFGYAESPKIRDGWLCFDVDMIGADAILAAMRNYVSLEIEEDAADGEGNRYGEAITRIALTPSPVVSGQRFAAAHGAQAADVYSLAEDEAPRVDPDLTRRAGRAYNRSTVAMANDTDQAIEQASVEAEAVKAKLTTLSVEQVEAAAEALEYDSALAMLGKLKEPEIVGKLAETIHALRGEMAAMQNIMRGLGEEAKQHKAERDSRSESVVAASHQADPTAARTDPDLRTRSARAYGR